MTHAIKIALDLHVIEHAIRRLGELRHDLTFGERLRLGEALRDVADELDRGGAIVDC